MRNRAERILGLRKKPQATIGIVLSSLVRSDGLISVACVTGGQKEKTEKTEARDDSVKFTVHGIRSLRFLNGLLPQPSQHKAGIDMRCGRYMRVSKSARDTSPP
jgi:hypothetical protein